MRIDRRKMGAVLFIIVCMALYTGWYSKENNELKNEHEGIIRFHVLANSDSEEDQALKLKVRDGVLEAINEDMIRETMEQYDTVEVSVAEGETDSKIKKIKKVELDEEASRAYIVEHIDFIEETAERIIQENGYDYDVKAELGIRWIPEKTYGEMTFPAGNYEALNITIGAGEGHNWWCVLFPPLCLIDSSTNVGNADEIMSKVPTQTAIQLKFKTLEIMQKANL